MNLTRHGVVFAALAPACAIVGWVIGSLELYVICGCLAALVVSAVVYTRVLRFNIAVERRLMPPRVQAGTPSRVELRVRNVGRRRTPVIGLRDAVSGTRGAHLRLQPLAPGATASAAYRLPTERRGIVEVGPLEVAIGDPFGLTRIMLRATDASELTVFPRVDEIVPVPQTTGNDPMAGAEHPNALGRSGEDFYGLRPYMVGDDLRKVHWASMARHDELMVRQDEQPWQGRATLLVDVRQIANTPASLELLVSAAASVVTASARRQDLIRLVTTDGTDSGVTAGHVHTEALMEHLASVQASPATALDPVLDLLARTRSGGALIAVVAHLEPAERERLARLRHRFGSVRIVQFEPPSWDPTIPSAPAAVSRHGSLHIRAPESFAQVWNASIRPDRSRTHRVRRNAPLAEHDLDDDRWSRHARIRP